MTNKRIDDIITIEGKEREEIKMKRFEVYVAGSLIGTYETREEAEARLFEARHSFLAMVHPQDVFYIKEKA